MSNIGRIFPTHSYITAISNSFLHHRYFQLISYLPSHPKDTKTHNQVNPIHGNNKRNN